MSVSMGLATSRVTGDVLLSLSGVYLISVGVHFALNILSNGVQHFYLGSKVK